jgi:hypothetical protein
LTSRFGQWSNEREMCDYLLAEDGFSLFVLLLIVCFFLLLLFSVLMISYHR